MSELGVGQKSQYGILEKINFFFLVSPTICFAFKNMYVTLK